MRRKILLITCEILPLSGYPLSGGGIRVWGLIKGLESRGHEVIYSVSDPAIEGKNDIPDCWRKNSHSVRNINEIISRVSPDLVIFEQWGLATYLKEIPIPVVIDLHGSLILENIFRDRSMIATDILTKIRVFQRADLLICAGERQKKYFWSWALMAGMDPLDLPVRVIPLSLPPDPPSHRFPEDLTFVHGGTLWPWIDPFPALDIVSQKLKEWGRGVLELYVGSPPGLDEEITAIDRLRIHLGESDHVKINKPISHDDMIQRYINSSVAVDLYRINPERELAFTTRTVEYLWCGLPVIYGNYGELSQWIEKYQAGWVVSPEDTSQIGKIVEKILNDPKLLEKRGAGAARLVREQFNWEETISPLDEFCRNPTIRRKERSILTNLNLELDRKEEDLVNLKREIKDWINTETNLEMKYKILQDDMHREITGRDKDILKLNQRLEKAEEEIEAREIDLLRRQTTTKKQRQRIEDLEGILWSLKNRLPYRIYKKYSYWRNRLLVRRPRLIYLFWLNISVNYYRHRLERKHQFKIFPGQ